MILEEVEAGVYEGTYTISVTQKVLAHTRLPVLVFR